MGRSDLCAAGAFGIWNLVGEIGALLSPVVGGVVRQATGGRTLALGLPTVPTREQSLQLYREESGARRTGRLRPQFGPSAMPS